MGYRNSALYTLKYVAEMLEENEDFLLDCSIEMFSEDGCLSAYDGYPATELSERSSSSPKTASTTFGKSSTSAGLPVTLRPNPPQEIFRDHSQCGLGRMDTERQRRWRIETPGGLYPPSTPTAAFSFD
ncbi:hypothetical protein [Mesorhizobium sp.]|uniref:hypothetical protein n=1 Tax=Mesorhizobium sp. TaxID=1871066 RepID=UPI0025F6A091|nr:hypothetical protein [Mesorhizobium sp.]